MKPMPTDYYKQQLESGLRYQDFVYEVLAQHGLMTVGYSSQRAQYRLGENKAGIEIKHDKNLKVTGNLYIEVEEKSEPSRRDYVPSGIQRDSRYYLIGDYTELFMFTTPLLREFGRLPGIRIIENRLKTSRAFLIHRDEAMRMCSYMKVTDKKLVQFFQDGAEVEQAKVDLALKRLLQQVKTDPKQIGLF